MKEEYCMKDWKKIGGYGLALGIGVLVGGNLATYGTIFAVHRQPRRTSYRTSYYDRER